MGWSINGLSSITICSHAYGSFGSAADDLDNEDLEERLCLDGERLILKDHTRKVSSPKYWRSNAFYFKENDDLTMVVAHGVRGSFLAYKPTGGVIEHYPYTITCQLRRTQHLTDPHLMCHFVVLSWSIMRTLLMPT